MVALAASVGVAVMVDSMRASVSDWLHDLLSADLYIAAEGFDDGATLPADVVAQAPNLEPVSAFSSYRNRRLELASGRITLIAARLAAPSRSGFAFVRAAGEDPWTGFDNGGLLISEPLSYRLRLEPGDRLRLPTPAGETEFPVAGVFRDYASEHGRVFIAREQYARYWSDRQVNTLALFSDRGGDALFRAASGRFAQAQDLVFTAAGEIYAESMAVFDRTFRITEVLRLLALMVAFVGVLSALMAVQLERRKEYAVLRALGLTRGQVSRLIVLESAMLGALAGLLAIPTGLAMAWVLTAAIQVRAFGWSMPFLVTPGPLIVTLLLGVLAALLASIYPAWRSSWQAPAAQLRED
jgi:putative ABC transport system permease protein